MPGQPPGRRQPVRGVASLNRPASLDMQGNDSASSISMHRPASSSYRIPAYGRSSSWGDDHSQDGSSNPRSHFYVPARNSSPTVGWRPFSSGLPAPATAVPIYRGVRAASTMELPDSPPSTPPQSPPLVAQRTNDLDVVDNIGDEDTMSIPMAEISLDSKQNLISEATNAILSSDAATGKSSAQAVPTGAGLMPSTPEMSPDQNVGHCAVTIAKSFFHRIFSDFSDDTSVEDAGIELVCPGWSGAVLKSPSKRTLYVSMSDVVDQSQLREQVLAILDAASEKLGCQTVIIALERKMRDFALVLHGLCYVGGQVEPNSDFDHREGLVLVSIQL